MSLVEFYVKKKIVYKYANKCKFLIEVLYGNNLSPLDRLERKNIFSRTFGHTWTTSQENNPRSSIIKLSRARVSLWNPNNLISSENKLNFIIASLRVNAIKCKVSALNPCVLLFDIGSPATFNRFTIDRPIYWSAPYKMNKIKVFANKYSNKRSPNIVYFTRTFRAEIWIFFQGLYPEISN